MSTYLRMWEKIKATSEEDRKAFLVAHPRAEGKDVDFFGETYFDVDLLESVRNSIRQGD